MMLASCLLASAQELTTRNPEYRVHRSDVLDVKYRYTPEFDQTVSVRPDGRVSLNATGTFIAAGLTVDEFKAEVVTLSKARLVDPEVSVSLKEFEKPFVMVEGEVTTPGRVELRGDLSALDAIAMAGGFKPSSKQSRVLLLRQVDGHPGDTKVVDLKKLISGNKLQEAVQLHSGDVLYVTQNTLSKVERLAHMGSFGAYYNPAR